MRRETFIKLALCCLAPLIFLGCGDDSSKKPSAGGGSSAAAGGASAKPVGDDFKIVILTNGSSPFWDACDRGLKDAGQKLGVRVELVRNVDASEGGQIRRLEQLATQNDVKGVGVSV